MASYVGKTCEQILREHQEYIKSRERCRAIVAVFNTNREASNKLREIQSECELDPNSKLSCGGNNYNSIQCMYIHQSNTRIKPHDDRVLDKCRESEPSRVVRQVYDEISL